MRGWLVGYGAAYACRGLRALVRRAPALLTHVLVAAALLVLAAAAPLAYLLPEPNDPSDLRRLHAAVTALAVSAYLRWLHHLRRTPALADEVGSVLVQAFTHLHEGVPELAFPLLRQALDDPRLRGTARGEVAAALGWALLHHDPDDPVPDEVRRVLSTAVAHARDGETTCRLRSYVHVHDGEAQAALRLAEPALARVATPMEKAQLLSILAVARHQQGELAQARTCREAAQHLWPALDMLPWVDEQLALAGA